MMLFVTGRIVISHQIRFDLQSFWTVLFQMDADTVRVVARKELIARAVELFTEIIGLSHEDMFVRDLVHFIGVAVCNNVHCSFFFEQCRHWVDDE